MIFLYRILTNLLYPILVLLIYLRKLNKKEDPIRYKEKIFPKHFDVKRNKDTILIWFHTASIGELKSIIPLIQQLNKSNEKIEFLITTVTLSSGNIASKEICKFKNVYHRYFPLDINFLLKAFFSSWKPNLIFLVDSEIWPNLILEAKKRGITLALLNGRITKKTFDRWKLIKNFAKNIFCLFDVCFSSNLETSKYLREFNVKNVYNFGNLKLINSVDLEKLKNINEDFLKKRRFWFAASTHNGEEVFCLKTHLKLKEKFNDIITIIAPRHIHRVFEIKKLCDDFSLKSQILNDNEKITLNKEIIIINSFGELPNYFKFTKSVFIGKSLIEIFKESGGQNPLEAANCGCKIYHGPFVYNFQEIYEILNNNKISKRIKNYHELSENLILDFNNTDQKSENVLAIMKELSDKTNKDHIKYINKLIRNENIQA